MRHLLLVVPARNEEHSITQCLDVLARERGAYHQIGVEIDVLVVVNNSSDRTFETAASLQGGHNWLQVEETIGRGKGLAIRHGWEKGRDIVAFTDADLAADITALRGMVKAIVDDSADLVVASRYLDGPRPERGLRRTLLSLCYRQAARMLIGLPVRDAQCGLKAARYDRIAPVLHTCEETGWLLDSEMLFHANSMGLRILEVPVRWTEGERSNLRTLPVAREVIRFLLRLRRNR